MNPSNYASLLAAQRLVENGIVLETEKVWALNAWPTTIDGHVQYKEGWRLIDNPMIPYKEQYPAPMFTEVWRELPDRFNDDGDIDDLFIKKDGDKCIAGYGIYSDTATSENPTDTLCDLRIWVKGRREK
jgi:hypothetical protein